MRYSVGCSLPTSHQVNNHNFSLGFDNPADNSFGQDLLKSSKFSAKATNTAKQATYHQSTKVQIDNILGHSDAYRVSMKIQQDDDESSDEDNDSVEFYDCK